MKATAFGAAMGRVALAGTVTRDDIVKPVRPKKDRSKVRPRQPLPFAGRYTGWDNRGLYPRHAHRPRPKKMTEADYRAIEAAEDKRNRRCQARRGWSLSRART